MASSICRSGRVVHSFQLQIGIAQRRGRKKLCEVANTPGLALPFFSRDDDGCKSAVTGNGLRAARAGTVEDLAEISFGLGYRPLALVHSGTSHRKKSRRNHGYFDWNRRPQIKEPHD